MTRSVCSRQSTLPTDAIPFTAALRGLGEVRCFHARTSAAHLPGLDFTGELIGRQSVCHIHILDALLDFAEYMEAIDDLVERHIIGQALDGVDGVLFGGACMHGGDASCGRTITL